MAAKQRIGLAALAFLVACAEDASAPAAGAEGTAARRVAGGGVDVAIPEGFVGRVETDAVFLRGPGGIVTVGPAPTGPAVAPDLCRNAVKMDAIDDETMSEFVERPASGVLCRWVSRPAPKRARLDPASIMAVLADGERRWIAMCSGRTLDDVDSIRPACDQVLRGWKAVPAGGGAP